MTEAKDADTWTQIVAPLVARCEVAAAFNAEAVWGPKGAAGLGGVLKRMAEIIDDEIEARGAREHRIESEDE